MSVTRVTFGPGTRWPKDLKDYAGTDTCLLPHVVVTGALHVVMDDGTEETFSESDVMVLPPGHDAWSVDGEACTFIEFSAGGDSFAG